MINHQGRPWEASRIGDVEGGVLKVGRAVKSPARYVPFADLAPWSLLEAQLTSARVLQEGEHPGLYSGQTNTS